MNLSSRTAAGRSRSADADAFLRPNVVHTTGSDRSSSSGASPHAWKRVLQERVWSAHGPKGMAARSVLMLLVWHADANGRAWLGIQAIASKTGAGNLRTVRNALDVLVRGGWLQYTPQTWATLTAEQAAAGRPAPRRGDVGQAPNLYVVLDGKGNGVTSTADVQPPNTTTGLALARASILVDRPQESTQSPGQMGQGGPGQIDQGGPLADLPCDLDPKGSPSRIESAERASRAKQSTHHFSKIRTNEPDWLNAWNVIVEVHADKTKSVYGLPPLPPDLKREQQQALAECLDGAALDVRAKLRDRTGAEQAVVDVQRDLATRVIQLYFKRDNEHLRRVKHALRDLPREFHARITEAMQLLLRESHDVTRESHDATKPRQTQPKTKIVETNEHGQRPTPLHTADAVQATTAREARRLLETLSAAPGREEPSKQASREHELPTRPKFGDVGTTAQHLKQSSPDKPNVQDKPHAPARAGAPRWGAVGPRPIKVRKVSKVPLDELDGEIASVECPPIVDAGS